MKYTKFIEKACCNYKPLWANKKWYKHDKRYPEWKKFYKKYGFYPFEVWNLDETVITFILPRLVYYRDHHASVPYGMSDEDYTKEIDSYVKAFQKYLSTNPHGKLSDETRETMRKFMDALPGMWDQEV